MERKKIWANTSQEQLFWVSRHLQYMFLDFAVKMSSNTFIIQRYINFTFFQVILEFSANIFSQWFSRQQGVIVEKERAVYQIATSLKLFPQVIIQYLVWNILVGKARRTQVCDLFKFLRLYFILIILKKKSIT